MSVGDRSVFADAELAAYRAAMTWAAAPSPRESGVEGARAAARQRAAQFPAGPEVESVSDLVIDVPISIPVRLYRPSREPRPIVVYFHGGGWTTGDLDTHDAICRRFARNGDVTVLAVEYRLAPEHPWPAAVDDAVGATRYALSHAGELGGTGSVGVAGDSAGGHLSALTAIALRTDTPPLSAQVLIYPNTDLSFSQPSVVEKATGWGLTADTALFFAEQWVPDVTRRSDPGVSPLAEPDLHGLPPAIVVAAEHDPLRDEAIAYAERLAEADVEVTQRVERGLIHGFLSLDSVSPAAKHAGDRIFEETGALLRRNP